MLSSEGLPDRRAEEAPDRRAKAIAAAHAAASWARARRATWTDEPLRIPEAPALPFIEETLGITLTPEVVEPPLIMPPPAAAPPAVEPRAVEPPAVEPRPVEPRPVEPRAVEPRAVEPQALEQPGMVQPGTVRIEDAGPSAVARAIDGVRSLGAPVARWLPYVAGAMLFGAAVVGGFYLLPEMPSLFRDTTAPMIEPPAATASRGITGADPKARRVGGLRVASTPTGARVIVDGKARGVTPLTLADLAVGPHTVDIESTEGKIRRSVTVGAGETAAINEVIFAGWLAVYAPFELTITEGERSYRPDDRNQIMLPAGQHELRLVNKALGYEAVRAVELKPGEITTLSITPPRSDLTVTATEAAEVWLDGARAGETPLNALPIDLGTHEVVVKRAAGGERRFTITVTVKPFALDVDFSKPPG